MTFEMRIDTNDKEQSFVVWKDNHCHRITVVVRRWSSDLGPQLNVSVYVDGWELIDNADGYCRAWGEVYLSLVDLGHILVSFGDILRDNGDDGQDWWYDTDYDTALVMWIPD